MTEDQIERAVERKVDRLDALFMTTDLTQAEYDAAQKEVQAWADREYSWCEAERRAGTHVTIYASTCRS